MRARRRALSDHQQTHHAQSVVRIIRRSNFFYPLHFACYWASDGELSLHALMQALLATHKKLYLPVLKPLSKSLWFNRYLPHQSLTKNQYGIPEPVHHKHFPIWALDVVFLPLVAFDEQGNRLGMGGGYYDRTLAALSRHPRHKPQLVGIGHECQKCAQLPFESWDIPLDWIVTEKRCYRPLTNK